MLRTKWRRAGHSGMNLTTFTKLRHASRRALRRIPSATLAAAVVTAAIALPEAAIAGAVSWVGINADPGKSLLFLDTASITRAQGTDRAWLLFDFRDPQSMQSGFGLKHYQSVKELVAVRCSDRSYARIKEIEYSGLNASGRTVSAYAWKPDERRYQTAVPMSASQAIVDSVCHAYSARTKVGRAMAFATR
ncbi:MAG: hypothetical protein IH605_11205 [Burkholderiales bacterium]|nr:hypothetical protein [Burkholderiales bacterium]